MSLIESLAAAAKRGDASGFPATPGSPAYYALMSELQRHLRAARQLDDERAAEKALDAVQQVLRAWAASMTAATAIESAARGARHG